MLSSWLSDAQQVLNAELLGMYLYGSLVAGDFVEDVSDIDLLVVTQHDVGSEGYAALQTLHASFSTRYPAFLRRIDITYMSQGALSNMKSGPSPALTMSDGGSLEQTTSAQHWLIDWYKVQEDSVTLYGPPPSEVIPHINSAEMKEYARQFMATKLPAENHSPAYAVLTACRGLFTLRRGELASKSAGAKWAAETYPQWASLIHEAARWNRDVLPEDTKAKMHLATSDFITFAIREAQVSS
jgi:predicted nucleotidyltransferase